MTATITTGAYVFGIVAARTPVPAADARGPARELHLVAAGELAALVGRIDAGVLGRAADLRAHDRVLAEVVASGQAVLPMRFGAVLPDDAAVVDDLLIPHHDEFSDALARLRCRVQYSLKVQYREEPVLAEIVANEPEIRELRARSAAGDPAAQLRLGELVVRALERLRVEDCSLVLSALPRVVDLRLREESAPDVVVDVAILVDRARVPALETAAERIAADNAARMRFTLSGPSAAYDFVGTG